jgi:hypothetical protein
MLRPDVELKTPPDVNPVVGIIVGLVSLKQTGEL